MPGARRPTAPGRGSGTAGVVLLPVAFVASPVQALLAAVAANRHEFYRYRVNWRLVR